MTDAVLVINAGSSSLKFSVFHIDGVALAPVVTGNLEELTGRARFRAVDPSGASIDEHAWPEGESPGHDGALAFLLDWLHARPGIGQLSAVGHRVVHGGVDYAGPVRITAEVVAKLERLVPLAPLHQPHNLQSIRAIAQRAPELAQVACLDTAFHRAQEPIAQAFALPPAITDRGVRRYGFHGLSYEYIAYVLPRYDAAAARGRVECVERHARIAGKRWAARKAGDRSFLPIAFGASEVRWQPPSADWMRWSLPAASASTR